MEVKPGYKQTEVGVIPEEWHAMRVCEFGSVVTGGTPRTEIHAYWNGSYPWVTPTDITDQRDMWASERMISESGLRSIRQLPANSVLVTCIASIGKNAILRSVGGCNQQINAVVPQQKQSPEFLYYSFESSKQYLLANAGMTATHIISKAAFEQLKFPIPPPPEQRAIATALSDVDGLLGGLDRLIAKKRDLKQAAMQQLLTGQTRLPGFHGEWEVKRLGDILTVRHGKSQHGITASDGKYPILASGGEIGRTNAFIYDKPSVLIGRKGTIDSPQYVDSPFWTVDTLFFTEIAAEADAKFVFYKFTMIRWRSYNEASGVPSLNAKTIENIEIQTPPLPEQTAIAGVLSEMDGELAVLEQRQAKTRALKQGMMQELLTGRTRLV